MPNIYPNQKLFNEVQGGRFLAAQHEEAIATRLAFNYQQEQFAKALNAAGANADIVANQAAFIPDDAWREVDEVTMRVLRKDEGQAYMSDLMPLARAVDIGKTAHIYRTSSDLANRVNVTLNGQTPTLLDKVDYTFNGHPIPIFDSGYGLNWREWRGMQSEGFDGISDDQEAAVANVEQVAAQYVLNGDTSINAGGYIGYGITNHPETNVMDLDTSGFNIDLTSFTTTSNAIEDFFVRDFQQVRHNNLIMEPMNVYVSPEIERRFSRSYSQSGGFKDGTMKDFLEGLPFINEIKMTYELTGNQFFSFPLVSRYIRPLMGMAMTTIAIPRVMMTDDYNFKVMKAMGLEIRADANSRSGVIYGAEIP